MPKSIEELAMELIELEQTRPPKNKPLNPGEKITMINPAYKEHMHQEWLRQQEIYGRIGIDNGNERIQACRKALDLLSPAR